MAGRTQAIASVILAAGASTRMGRPKMLLPVAGTTLLASTVAPHLGGGIGCVVVVLGHEAETVRQGAGLRGLKECGEAE